MWPARAAVMPELTVNMQQDAGAVAVAVCLPYALSDAPVHPASSGCCASRRQAGGGARVLHQKPQPAAQEAVPPPPQEAAAAPRDRPSGTGKERWHRRRRTMTAVKD